MNVRARYYIPSLHWLPNYKPTDLIHDFLAGATVACVLIPQGLSYAINLAKLDPILGLYTSSFPVIVYGMFGTSRQLSVGPDALVSILVGSAVSQYVPPDLSPSDTALYSSSIASTLCVLVGLITFALGFFRFGFLDSVLSRALLRGFISAIALVIMIEQVPSLLGLGTLTLVPPPLPSVTWISATSTQQQSPFDKWLDICKLVHNTHVPTLLVSVVSIVFLFGTRILKSRLSYTYPNLHAVPEILVLVIISVIMSWSMDLHRVFNIPILGLVQVRNVSNHYASFPVPKLPSLVPFSLIRSLFMPAVLISILGFVESIVVTKQYASAHNYAVSRNRELVAFGIANVCGSLMGAYPAFGSLSRSRVNDHAGARTQLAAIISGVLVLVTMIWFLPYLFHLPKAVMSAVIFVAAISLLELDDLYFIFKLHAWNDLACLLFTFVITLFVSIEAGILSSIALSLMLVVKDVAMPKITILHYSTTTEYDMDHLDHHFFQPSVATPTPNSSGIKFYTYNTASDTNASSPNLPQYHQFHESTPCSPLLGASSTLPYIFDQSSTHSASIAQEPVDPFTQVLATSHVADLTLQLPITESPICRTSTQLSFRPDLVHSVLPDVSSDLMVIVRIDESLHFANTGELRERLMRAELFGTMETHPSEAPTRINPLRLVVFQMRNMAHIDASAAQIMYEIVVQYRNRNIGVAVVRVRHSVWQILERAEISRHVVAVNRISDAVRSFGLVHSVDNGM